MEETEKEIKKTRLNERFQKVEVEKCPSAKISRFSLGVCSRVGILFTDQVFKSSQYVPMTKILSRVFVSRQAANIFKHSS